MTVRRFDFAFAPAYRAAALPFGIVPRTAYAEVGDGHLRIRFGPWSLRTELANITGSQVSGGYAFLRTAGPAHLSLSDHGVTFATNGTEGVCLTFREPVKVLDPTGRLRHPGATLTLADGAGFLACLGSE